MNLHKCNIFSPLCTNLGGLMKKDPDPDTPQVFSFPFDDDDDDI